MDIVQGKSEKPEFSGGVPSIRMTWCAPPGAAAPSTWPLSRRRAGTKLERRHERRAGGAEHARGLRHVQVDVASNSTP